MQMDTDPILYWIGLSSIPGVGRITFRKLVNRFGSPERALSASHEELKNAGGLSDKIIASIRTVSWRAYAEQELARSAAAGIELVTSDNAGYPGNLKQTPDPPLYLYVKGALQPDDANAIAIVGTRKPTHYGKTVTHRLAYELASAGLTIVSGMARGIDTHAHKGALSAKGRTIAVLGSGIDVAYPPENKGLMEEIAANGAVITENPFGTKPEAGYFPARNRIISGLSRGTVIIEAAEDSGSLITAKNTLEQGRKLFAVPGNIGSMTSRGPNSLIKDGAILVERVDDIMKALGMHEPRARQLQTSHPLPSLTQEEENVFRCITNEPKHIDSIMKESGSSAGKLSGLLINLELKGLAKQLSGKYFVRQD
jgi:DNA processing protein